MKKHGKAGPDVKDEAPAELEYIDIGNGVKALADLEALCVHIDSVHPDPANPRRLVDLQPLKDSIRRFGIRRPIVVNKRDGLVEAGHQTLTAAKALGADRIPVVWADDDTHTAHGFNIADNRTAEVVAEWDEGALDKLLEELRTEDTSAIIGFSDKEQEELEKEVKKAGDINVVDTTRYKRTWVLFGIGSERYGEVIDLVEKLKRMENVVVYDTAESTFEP